MRLLTGLFLVIAASLVSMSANAGEMPASPDTVSDWDRFGVFCRVYLGPRQTKPVDAVVYDNFTEEAQRECRGKLLKQIREDYPDLVLTDYDLRDRVLYWTGRE